jgi:hypothetical protein
VTRYRFWNRTSDNDNLGDTAAVDPATGAYPTSRPIDIMAAVERK